LEKESTVKVILLLALILSLVSGCSSGGDLPPQVREEVMSLHGETALNLSGENVVREYTWDFAGTPSTVRFEVPRGLYDYYRGKARSEGRGAYVSSKLDDEYVSALAYSLKNRSEERNLTRSREVDFVASFVQSMENTPSDVTAPYDGVRRYPVETLVEKGGDSEDSALLILEVLRGMGYEAELIQVVNRKHVMVGVGDGFLVAALTFDEGKYHPVESVGSGWGVGQVPGPYRGDRFRLSRLTGHPELIHRWNVSSVEGRDLVLNVDVDNVGKGDAENVKVKAEVQSKDGELTDSQTTPGREVPVDSTVTFTPRV